MTPIVLLHLHIPKSAGSSVGRVLLARFPGRVMNGAVHAMQERLANLSVEEADAKFDVISGHLPWGLHENFSRDYLYLSTIRDPVARICSYFNFIHSGRGHPLKSYLDRRLKSLNDIKDAHFEQPGIKREWSNYLRRTYVGADDVPIDETMRHIWRHVRSGRFVVGDVSSITSFLQDSGLLAGPLSRANATPEKPKSEFEFARPETLTPRATRVIRKHNKRDFALINRLQNRDFFYGSDRYPPIEKIAVFKDGKLHRAGAKNTLNS